MKVIFTTTILLLAAFAALPSVDAKPAEPMCMYYYYEIDLGPVRYVQRDSCTNEIYVLGERIDDGHPLP
jgi:hypothetical protein